MKQKEKNSFDRTVEMFKDMGADCLYLSDFEPYGKGGMVTGEACNSKTGTTWALSMLSSIEEAIGCKYPLVCGNNDKVLIKYLDTHKKSKSFPNNT